MELIAIVNQSAPHRGLDAQESLDLVLAMANFGNDVTLYFVEDGVFQLLQGQQPEAITQKNFIKTFAALEFYDIENIVVCSKSLAQRNLTEDDLVIDVRAVSPDVIAAELRQAADIWTF